MLQKIRDNAHGWWTWVFVPLLIVIFALFGIQNYLGGGFAQNEVARVNGQSISVNAFSMIYQSMNNAQNEGAGKQPSSILKLQALNALVTKAILAQSLQQLGFSVSDARIADLILKIPAFQQNGQFSMPIYQGYLQNSGLTTADLKADLAESDLITQFQNGLNLSAFALPSEINRETAYAKAVRDVDYVNVPLNLFIPKTMPTDTEINTYYAAHQNNFVTPLQLKLAYVKISQSQFTKNGNTQAATASYSAALNQIANLAFQNADSLGPIAQAYHLSVTNTGELNTAHPTDILANSAVLQAVKGNSVLNQGNNSSVINLSPTEAVVVRVISSTPQTPLPLSQVKPQIIAALQQEQAMNAASNTVNSMVNAINEGGNLTDLAKGYNLSLQHVLGMNASNQTLPAPLTSKLSTMAANQGIAFSGSNTSVIVAEVIRVYSDPKAKTTPVSAQAIMSTWNQIELMQYLAAAQAHAKINVNQAFFKQP